MTRFLKPWIGSRSRSKSLFLSPRGIWIISLTREPTGTALSGCGPVTLFYRRHGIRHSQVCCVKSIIGTIAG